MNFDKLQRRIYSESFYHGFENHIGYSEKWVEVFRNPSTKELQEIGKSNVGMLLTPQDVFLWDRNLAYHYTVMRELRLMDSIPILFYWDNKEAFCRVTDASEKSKFFHDSRVSTIIRSNPWMRKRFSEIDVEYYDHDIVGDWDNI